MSSSGVEDKSDEDLPALKNEEEKIEIISQEDSVEVNIEEIIEETIEEVRDEEVSDEEDMSTTSEERGSFRAIPTFDGKKENYQRFMLKFRAYASERGFKRVLTSSDDKPEDPEAAGLTEVQQKWVKENEKAVSAYTMALTGEEVFEVICNSVTENYPDGLAYQITEELKREYQPDDGTSSLEYLNKLNKLKLSKTENPAKIFNKVAAIRMSYGTTENKVQERDLVMAIIRAAPKQYSETIENVLNEKGDELKVKDLKEVMNRKFRFLVAKGSIRNEGDDDSDDDENETVLAAGDFKGKCYRCGKIGHKANDPKCPMFESYRFKGLCQKCGRRGHKEEDCWEHESNKDKRPPGWKSRLGTDEKGNLAVNFEELLL